MSQDVRRIALDRPDILAECATVDEGKRNLDLYGYTIHRNAIPADLALRLRDRVMEQAELELEAGVAMVSSEGHAGGDMQFSNNGGRLPVSQQVSFLPNKGRIFVDLLREPIAMEYAAHLFKGLPFNIATQSALILRNGGKRQVLHSDQQAVNFPTPMPVMFNYHICLSDWDAEMGATNVVPGSHQLGAPDFMRSADDVVEEVGGALVPMTGKIGDVLIFESRTWHCQGDSVSPKTRISAANVYALHCMKPQDFYPAILHDDVYETLTDEDKDMLGFKVAFGYGGRIGARNPTDPRANTNLQFPYIPELRRGGAKQALPLGGRALDHRVKPEMIEVK